MDKIIMDNAAVRQIIESHIRGVVSACTEAAVKNGCFQGGFALQDVMESPLRAFTERMSNDMGKS